MTKNCLLKFSGCVLFFCLLNSCIVVGGGLAVYPNGLTVELDKAANTSLSYQADSVYFYNNTGERISKVQARAVGPTFDQHDPNAEPNWSNVAPLVYVGNPSKNDISDREEAYLKIDAGFNLCTVFFKITTVSGKSCVFALIPENDHMWRVQVRAAK